MKSSWLPATSRKFIRHHGNHQETTRNVLYLESGNYLPVCSIGSHGRDFELHPSCKRNFSMTCFCSKSNLRHHHREITKIIGSTQYAHPITTHHNPSATTILNSKSQLRSYKTSSSDDRRSLIKKEENNISTMISLIHSHLDQGVDFTKAEERDVWVETLLSHLEDIAKCIEKITWLEGTKSFSTTEQEEPVFTTLFDNPFETNEEELSKSSSQLENLIIRVLDVLHGYGKQKEVQQVESTLSLSSIGLDVYSIMKRYALEFERASPKELSKFLEQECFFSLNQNVMNFLLRYFADIKDKSNTVIVLKDMQQLQLGANEQTYNILIRFAMYGNDQNQVLKLVKHMKQQGLELNQETKDLLRKNRLI
ncbi:hypothetical protein C9374_009095 [Naegleria lovaniensis]|uniref:Uncharacterized protein n=1 Tax=Naegleria lovaniensis TaxID=51637 RepID=A0AA88KK82_NAELO|nr:uncharacterized protein C9374_009095 [Naegleria lovaniensis]KAG2377579.1 hypothetical protein C9374_009095 [Naegleria lovaniensis]